MAINEIPEKKRKFPKWGTNFWRPQLFQVVSDLSENSPVDASRRAASIGEGISTGGRESGEKRPNFDPTCSSASLRPKFSPLFWRENPYWGCDEWVGRHTILRKHSTFQSQMQHRRRPRLKKCGPPRFRKRIAEEPGARKSATRGARHRMPKPLFQDVAFQVAVPKNGVTPFLGWLDPRFWDHQKLEPWSQAPFPVAFSIEKG